MERSQAQRRSEPDCPAQKAVIVYIVGRSRLVFDATYLILKSRVRRRYIREAEAIVRRKKRA